MRVAVTLSAIVLAARQMGLWIARAIVEQQLNQRARMPTQWMNCSVCGTQLCSKGFVKHQILTLVGWVKWKRRIGRCPCRCRGSHQAPFDRILRIQAHQQTSTELIRLGCLLAVFLPFELAAWLLEQLTGIAVSRDTIWRWVQAAGQKTLGQLQQELNDFHDLPERKLLKQDLLDSTLEAIPLIIAADGVTVPFRPQPKTPKGRIVWREIKVALLARLGKRQTKTGDSFTCLHQRRLVAVLGSIDDLKPRLQLEALRQGIKTDAQVIWISDGARGFWRLYQQ